MANLFNYVDYYGKKTFDEIPLGDVDALLFAELSYLPLLKNIRIPFPLTIEEFAKAYLQKITDEDMKKRMKLYREVYQLLKKIYQTPRYQNIIISNFEQNVNEKGQFGAMTLRTKKWVYIAFEGTDDSITGWKEDFALSYAYPLSSQRRAISYLEEEVKLLDKVIYVGGHSKGGNLALVAALESSLFTRSRIQTVYNFDGPGLLEREYHSLKYKKIRDKIKMFVPRESVVGMLLCHDMNYTVVRSSASSFLQHDGFSWECFGNVFVEGELSKKSITLSKDMRTFLKDISDTEREKFVSAIFLVLEKAGITSIEKVTFSKLLACLSFIGELKSDQQTKEKLKKIFSMVLAFYKP